MGVAKSWTSLSLQRVNVNGADLEYRTVGNGEPVVLIHGAHIADAVMPLLGEPALSDRFQLIAYHRRGFAGSSRIDHPLTVSEQAADCHGLLQALGVQRAHIMGFSFGGDVALQLALDAPDVIQTIAVLEPPLVFLPSAAAQVPSLMAAMGLYQSGDKASAVDPFMRMAVGPDYRTNLDRVIPGAFEQAVADADTFFLSEFQTMPQWNFTSEAAALIQQPALVLLGGDSPSIVAGAQEGYELLLDWLPRSEGLVVPGTTHSMPMQQPQRLAEALAGFFARHPMLIRA